MASSWGKMGHSYYCYLHGQGHWNCKGKHIFTSWQKTEQLLFLSSSEFNEMSYIKSCNSFLQHYWEHQIGMCKLKLWLYMLPYLYEDRCEHSGVKGWFKVALRADRAKQQLHGGIQVLVVLNLFSTLKVWTYTATGKISLKTSLEFSRWRIMRF